MGQDPGGDKNEPSLELPSLSLRGLRRNRRKPKSAVDESLVEETGTPTATSPGDEPTTTMEPPAPARPETRPETRAETPVYDADDAQSPRTGMSFPTLPGRVAAAVTGLVIGGVGVVATYAAMAGCEAVRGVSSCGDGPGFLILVAILALMVLLGMVVLKALQVGDPGSTSFLAVGIVTVVVMLILLDVVFSAWMFLVIPLLGAVAFTLSHWVTTQFGEETGRPDWS